MSTTMAATDCFTQYGDSYARPSESNHCFSAGVDWSSAHENAICQIRYGGYVFEEATVNITTTSKIKLYDAIH